MKMGQLLRCQWLWSSPSAFPARRWVDHCRLATARSQSPPTRACQPWNSPLNWSPHDHHVSNHLLQEPLVLLPQEAATGGDQGLQLGHLRLVLLPHYWRLGVEQYAVIMWWRMMIMWCRMMIMWCRMVIVPTWEDALSLFFLLSQGCL